MVKFDLDINKVLVISVILVLLSSSSLVLYENKKRNDLNNEFNAKLVLLNKDIVKNLNKLRQDTESDISSLKNNLTLKIDFIDTSFSNFRQKNDVEIATLNSLIDQIEKQSDIKLNELKQEVSTIKVKSVDFSSIIDNVIQSVVSVGTDKGQGSGVIVDDKGFIVTNWHVVQGANIIRVLTYDNKVYDAALLAYDDNVDVAVLKVNAELRSLRFDNSDNVKVGERVIALGNPAGLSFSVTEGIVSAVHRKGPNNLDIYLQTDVPINPGNSGGPLVNANSRIVGINDFKIGGYEGLGFAIESNIVKQIADEVIQKYEQQVQQP